MNQRNNIYKILYKWNKSSFFIDDLLSKNDVSDFSYRIIKGVVENKLFLDFIIKKYLNRNISPETFLVLEIALYELIYNESTKEYATVNEAVNLAKEKNEKDKNLVNAVLRNFIRDDKKVKLPDNRKKRLSVKYSYPVELIDIFLKSYSLGEVEEIFKYFQKQNYIDLRINTNLISRKKYIHHLESEKIDFDFEESLFYHIRIKSQKKVSELPGYKKGWFYVQDKAAQIISQLVNPIRNDLLDVGSAPGGKITYFSQLNSGKFELIAVESSKRRLKRMKENIARLKSENIKIVNQNFLEYQPGRKFDLIFLDPPCSGLGVIGKKADIKYRINKNDINSLVDLQTKLLNKASKILSKEGKIIYSTCTLNKSENENIIEEFLKKNKKFKQVDIKNKKYLKKCLNNDTLKEQKIIKIYPPSEKMDGMFACVLKKEGNDGF
ncbi:MAG: 16S rRNA (cytosine(967)-C(5))-methyltransferase RsmB [Candidatus Mcinerneyibacterium aminivorans]|uniref:16S rRNA (Cytosine(967)-C(5))-methyltransferase RsmB n=1 Tax=Candidatus Mcinerneyibacterium aminivorans TaxID=2703815 RepID=A0A5D0MH56_9BACT|nr:MAG: 16S rRNA (cytosine(967)-C(5))-methyltransferase RsmB [Candidatus Mcinerneyibacterium aminivorans]